MLRRHGWWCKKRTRNMPTGEKTQNTAVLVIVVIFTMTIYHVSRAHQPPQDNHCHVGPNTKSLVKPRSFSGRNHSRPQTLRFLDRAGSSRRHAQREDLWGRERGEIGDCFFTVSKIKTNPLLLATKDLVSKTKNPVALGPREMKAFLQIKTLRKISKFLPFWRYLNPIQILG